MTASSATAEMWPRLGVELNSQSIAEVKLDLPNLVGTDDGHCPVKGSILKLTTLH